MNGVNGRNLLPLQGDNIYPGVAFQFLSSYPFSSTFAVTRNLDFLKDITRFGELENFMNEIV